MRTDRQRDFDLLKRTPGLIRNTYRKMAFPNVSSQLSVMLLGFLSNLVAARFIGTEAVETIALTAPILYFENVLHDLSVSGTGPLMIRLKSRGRNREANRAFGAILIHQLWVYLSCFALLAVFSGRIFSFFTDDGTLIGNCVRYFIPWTIAYPIREAMLCLERGFKTDGRPAFFAARGVINAVLKIALTLCSVLVFRAGILGLAVASASADLLAFCWSCSHFFSKKCTSKPDLSVLKAPKEMRSYLKEEFAVGSVFASDDSMITLSGVILDKMLLASGGTVALAAYGIVLSVTNIMESINIAVMSSFTSACEMYYSDRDTGGTRTVFFLSLIAEAAVAVIFIAGCTALSGRIGGWFNASDPQILALLPFLFFFCTFTCFLSSVSNIFSSFLVATKRGKKAFGFNIINNLALTAGICLGSLAAGARGLFAGRFLCAFLLIFVEAYRIARAGTGLVKSRTEISEYSYTLTEQNMGEISARIYELFSGTPFAVSASLLTEEYNRQLLFINAGGKKKVLADLRVSEDDEAYVITVADNGGIFDPVARLADSGNTGIMDLSAKLLSALSPDAAYSRVLDLNISHIILKKRR